MVIDPAVPATCTAGGSTEWSHCSVCGTVVSAPVQLPALGHSMVNGKCTRCGYAESVIVTVDSVEALRAIANDMSGTYYLTADIDLSGTHWLPLGSASAPFTGTFNGGGHTIRFGMITITSENGLFHTNDGTVSNLNIIARGASFLNESYCGGYVAVVNNGIIENCEISGSRTYDFKVERTVAGTNPQKGENQKGVAEEFTANYSFGEICWKNNGSIISCESKGTVTISHNVYGAQWGHGYGLDILIPYFTSEGADHLYVYSDVTFGGVCAENYNTVQGCTLDASYGYTEKIATATQESAWWYANSRAYVCVKAGSVCGVNNGTLKEIRAGMLQLDSCEITKRTESSHESTSFEFVKSPDYTGLLAENKGECVNVAYK